MKRLSKVLLAAALVFSTISAISQSADIRQTSNTNESQPYKIAFSNLKFGNNEYSKMVLNAWKAYDNNQLDNIAVIIADTVTVGLPDGTMLKGRDNFLNALKTYRGGFSSMASTVDACTTLKSDKYPGSDVTVIWGTETGTKKDGTVQRSSLHEVWFFNKDGKVSEFYQYAIPLNDKK